MSEPTRKPRIARVTQKRQLNIRASDLTVSQLEDLMRWWGASMTEALTVAIDRIHRQESEKRTPPATGDQEDVTKL